MKLIESIKKYQQVHNFDYSALAGVSAIIDNNKLIKIETNNVEKNKLLNSNGGLMQELSTFLKYTGHIRCD